MTQETNPAGLFVAYDKEKHRDGHYFVKGAPYDPESEEDYGWFIGDLDALRGPVLHVLGKAEDPDDYLFGPAIPEPSELAAMQRKAEAMDALKDAPPGLLMLAQLLDAKDYLTEIETGTRPSNEVQRDLRRWAKVISESKNADAILAADAANNEGSRT